MLLDKGMESRARVNDALKPVRWSNERGMMTRANARAGARIKSYRTEKA